MLCQFRDIFGEPKTGAHSIRIFDIAIVDVILTLIGAKIAQYLINKQFDLIYPYRTYCLILFTLGIVLHELFCVETTINKFLFPKN